MARESYSRRASLKRIRELVAEIEDMRKFIQCQQVKVRYAQAGQGDGAGTRNARRLGDGW
jgi:hypothetical protein